MKTILLFSILSSLFHYSQVGINTNFPDKSAILHANATHKGLLISRVSLSGTTDITTIPKPAEGLLVFNLVNANNETPADTTDDVLENRFYSFSNGRWHLFTEEKELNQKISDLLLNRLITLVNMKPSGNDLSFVSSDLGNNIRRFIFDSKVTDKLNTFNTTTGEFTAPFTGYYLVNMNILLKPWKNNFDPNNNVKTPLLLGLSKPYTNSFPTSGLTDNIFYNAIENLDSARGANFITYLNLKSIIYLKTGEKTVPIVKYITPGSTEGQYNLNTEANNYNRTLTNTISIIYLPTS
ncbi:hypothetical protein IQ37_06025 [Chryseobacterium piperi]|uniref:C1q domain-containing protein n=1 Tax=Chryseobacterium piperi TaxID=558152 RepID=A0A086BK90_9FLAO|nr:hypothetical protein [Chryseobacterium piperi]ASW76135.1 hypothetical protein CJF12_18895 [Chryseobacterium piperi]KFF29354.1 hypothetical protein IQ37_06025 [Chryseobacterium piperi]